MLQRLSVPGVIRVHELLRYDQGCCLVLEDAGGTPLQALHPGARVDLDASFLLALQVATILSELHRRGLTHNHLNRAASCFTPRPIRSTSPISALPRRSVKHQRCFPSRSCLAHSHICHQSRLAG